MTESQQRALAIVRDYGPIRPREFAKKMWPDAEAHHHHTKCGPKGVSYGGGMNLAGGGYLGKLAKLGWVQLHMVYGRRLGSEGYTLTIHGRRALEEAENV